MEEQKDTQQVPKNSNKTKIIIAVVIIVILGLIGFFLMSSDSDDVEVSQSNNLNTSQPQNNTQQPNDTEQETAEEFTAEQVAQHNTESDCWTIIGDKVYDITSYVPRHPGGDEILRACGQDGTSLFESRSTESGEEVGSGTPHSSSARSQLSQLEIGSLKD